MSRAPWESIDDAPATRRGRRRSPVARRLAWARAEHADAVAGGRLADAAHWLAAIAEIEGQGEIARKSAQKQTPRSLDKKQSATQTMTEIELQRLEEGGK